MVPLPPGATSLCHRCACLSAAAGLQRTTAAGQPSRTSFVSFSLTGDHTGQSQTEGSPDSGLSTKSMASDLGAPSGADGAAGEVTLARPRSPSAFEADEMDFPDALPPLPISPLDLTGLFAAHHLDDAAGECTLAVSEDVASRLHAPGLGLHLSASRALNISDDVLRRMQGVPVTATQVRWCYGHDMPTPADEAPDDEDGLIAMLRFVQTGGQVFTDSHGVVVGGTRVAFEEAQSAPLLVAETPATLADSALAWIDTHHTWHPCVFLEVAGVQWTWIGAGERVGGADGAPFSMGGLAFKALNDSFSPRVFEVSRASFKRKIGRRGGSGANSMSSLVSMKSIKRRRGTNVRASVSSFTDGVATSSSHRRQTDSSINLPALFTSCLRLSASMRRVQTARRRNTYAYGPGKAGAGRVLWSVCTVELVRPPLLPSLPFPSSFSGYGQDGRRS